MNGSKRCHNAQPSICIYTTWVTGASQKHDARICEHKLSDATYDVLTRLKVSNR